MSGLSVPSSSLTVSSAMDPLPIIGEDAFGECMKFLDLKDLPNVARVCKAWNNALKSSNNNITIWKNLFQKHGIPLVINPDSKPRDYRADLKILFPMTISGKLIEEYFGKMVGEVPAISAEFFDLLQEEDSFEEQKPGNQIAKNYVVLVLPTKITRISGDENTPLALDAKGNLIESSGHSSSSSSTVTSDPGKLDLEIPFRVNNLVTLSKYPLKGKENGPVFNYVNPDVLEQCNACSTEIKVYLMRKRVVEESRNKAYSAQKELVNNEGWDVTPLRERMFYDIFKILSSGDCPDNQKPWTFARTSDPVREDDGIVRQSGIGGFAPRVGARVHHCPYYYGYDCEDVGVVPGVPAEVLRP